ncbi:NrsF family protein [Novosphingobium sp. Chol11]|uniref:NrsF family protein n=1 Tax=Novosphingobium sp. Chol11 TaxID=1385763 RepID=UPI0025D14E04|nr:NrsF family protein [Novosphingobium sp. Chol11]
MLKPRDPRTPPAGPLSDPLPESHAGSLIDQMVADLTPVDPLRLVDGVIAGLAATALVVGAVALLFGWRDDLLAGQPSLLVVARSGILLLAGAALLMAVVLGALPGRDDRAARRAGTLLLGLFPLGLAVLTGQAVISRTGLSYAEVGALSAARCFVISLCCALVVAGAVVAWLRRAAPTDLARAGWLTGAAAGALGTFAYSLFCPSNSLAFAVTVYPAAILLAALLSRLVVPQVVRW